jgi:transcription initiation factor TFIIF subunit beta
MSQAKLNQLASGFSNATSNLGKGMVLGQARVAPGERFARLERHELTDRLFALFNDKPYWSISALKATLQQPDAWLREVLKDVASLIKEGQYANMWELKENWKDMAGGDAKPDIGGDGGEDDDDSAEEIESEDEDMEEVLV